MAQYLSPRVEVRIKDDIVLDPLNVDVDLNLDFTADKFTVELENTNGTTLYKYGKFDLVEVWAGYDKADTRIFKGMITSIKPKSSTSGNTVVFEGQNMAAKVMLFPGFPRSYPGRNIKQLINSIFVQNQISDIKINKLSGSYTYNITLKTSKGDTVAKTLQQIKEKTAFEVWIDYDGELRIEPLSVLMRTQVSSLELTYGDNLITMEIGDLGQLYNRVEVYGLNPEVNKAAAEDKVLIAQMGQTRTHVIRDRSLGDYKSCLTLAQEKLLEMTKNFKIDATTIFLPTIKQGDAISVVNPFSGISGTFICQNVKHSIRPSGATSTVSLFGGVVSRLPESLVKKEIYSITKVAV